MYISIDAHDKRERILRLGTAVRARLREEFGCGKVHEEGAIDAIVYPGPEVSMYENSADDD
jgi:hypothetical protein